MLAPRRFNLGDMAIVVAAAAIFLALARVHDGPLTFAISAAPDDVSAPGGPSYDWFMMMNLIESWFEILGSGLVVATLVVILARLRQPRPHWRRLVRQPGWVACLAATIAALFTFATAHIQNAINYLLIASGFVGGRNLTLLGRPVIFTVPTAWAGSLAVVVAWVILRVDRRWRAERSWVDRTGRVLGILWLLTPLVDLGGRALWHIACP